MNIGRHVRIVVTDACNLACRQCFNEGYPTRGRLFALPDRLYSTVASFGSPVQDIKLTGGEPLLHPRIGEIAATLSEICPVSITSNGLFLSRRISDIPVETPITISIYGTTREQFCNYTQVAARVFDLFLREVEIVSRQPSRFRANILIRDDPHWQPEAFVEFSKSLGFRVIRFITLLGPRNLTGSYLTNFNRVKDLFKGSVVLVTDGDPSVETVSMSDSVRLQLVHQYDEFEPTVRKRFGFTWIGPLGEVYTSPLDDVFIKNGFLGRRSPTEAQT